MLRDDDIYYYCNLSSPMFWIRKGLNTSISDLDVKIFPDGEVMLLDRDEYDFNIKHKHYSQELREIIRYNLNCFSDSSRINGPPSTAKACLNGMSIT